MSSRFYVIFCVFYSSLTLIHFELVFCEGPMWRISVGFCIGLLKNGSLQNVISGLAKVAGGINLDGLTTPSFAKASFTVTLIISLASQFLHSETSYLELFEGIICLSNSQP